MSPRGGFGSYGSRYRSPQGDPTDPLASAIASIFGGYTEMAQQKRDNAMEERRLRAQEERAARDDARADRSLALQEQEMATREAERRDARIDAWRTKNEARKKEQAALGMVDWQNPTTGQKETLSIPGASRAKAIGEALQEDQQINQQVSLADAIAAATERRKLPELQGAARALGIKTDGITNVGELQALIKQAEAEANTRRNIRERGASGGGGGVSSKPLPGSVALSIGATEGILNAANDASAKFKTATDAKLNVTGPIIGRISGLLQDWGIAKSDSRAMSARAALANVASEIMKGRSGGAITPQEFEWLAPFIPSANESEESATQKLADLAAYLKTQRDTQLNSLEDAGCNVSRYRAREAGGGRRPGDIQ